jgi:hypothetical protein
MAIFTHTDDDGDSLEVLAQASNILWFRVDQDGEGPSGAYVDRDAALRLHAALGEWLYPVHTPEYANRSLIEQMIERAVKDQVAAVLPLHLAPVATYAATPAGTPGCECGHAADYHSEENGCCHWYTGDQEFCECTRGLGGLESDAFLEADPEPHDVGHAEDSACRCHDSDGNSVLPHAPKYVDASPAPGLLGATLAGEPTWDDLVFATHNEAPGGPGRWSVCGCLHGTALARLGCPKCGHPHRANIRCTDRVRQVPGE